MGELMKRIAVAFVLSALAHQAPAHAVRMVEATLSISHVLSGPATIEVGQAVTFSDFVTFTYTPPSLIPDPNSPDVAFTDIEFMSPLGHHELRLMTGRASDSENPVTFAFAIPQPASFFEPYSYSYTFSFDPVAYDSPGAYTLDVDARQPWASMSYAIGGLSGWRGDYRSNSGYSVENSSNQLSLMVSPIPEPETYAMLLAGLLFIGAIDRQRRYSRRTASDPRSE
jgi:hypothetical protein